jgi:LmbE family N-acetylglucosaminyl deacetylase
MIKFLMRRGAEQMAERKMAQVINAHAIDFVWRAVGEIARRRAKGYDVAVAYLLAGARGETIEGRANGDVTHGPNQALGAFATAPLYAARLFLGGLANGPRIVFGYIGARATMGQD